MLESNAAEREGGRGIERGEGGQEIERGEGGQKIEREVGRAGEREGGR